MCVCNREAAPGDRQESMQEGSILCRWAQTPLPALLPSTAATSFWGTHSEPSRKVARQPGLATLGEPGRLFLPAPRAQCSWPCTPNFPAPSETCLCWTPTSGGCSRQAGLMKAPETVWMSSPQPRASPRSSRVCGLRGLCGSLWSQCLQDGSRLWNEPAWPRGGVRAIKPALLEMTYSFLSFTAPLKLFVVFTKLAGNKKTQ